MTKVSLSSKKESEGSNLCFVNLLWPQKMLLGREGPTELEKDSGGPGPSGIWRVH